MNLKYFVLLFFAFNIYCKANTQNITQNYTDYVNPFIGTGGHGHTFPGATAPFGMVQLSPDTRLSGWDGCSGYHYSDSIIYGFSHTHLSGTGVSDYGDVLIMPVNSDKTKHYASTFKKSSEKAAAGYYSVFLDKPKLKSELTTTLRTGIHQYTWSDPSIPGFIIDLYHRDSLIDWQLTLVNDTVISGYRISKGWAEKQYLYFYIKLNKAVKINGDKDDAIRHFVLKNQSSNKLMIKVGISAVDINGAKANLETEAAGWDFEFYQKQNEKGWNEQLSKIHVEGGSQEERIKFYTALYHAMIAPNIFSDVDGRYRGTDLEIHQTDPNYPQYTVFSLWDTFRSTHPLYTLIEPIRTTYFLNTFLRQFRDGGKLPKWELAGNYTDCMIGYHSVSVIADAVSKGYINAHQIPLYLDAMLSTANHSERNIYKRFGYIPSDKEAESVSKTLEYAYDDWCIAQTALLAGNDSIYIEFIQRAQSYKNLYDPNSGFMRPKFNGQFVSKFDPTAVTFDFTEANAWQYSFFVPHDVTGLINLHGSPSAFENHLDKMFKTFGLSGRNQSDITGLIGQYAHGNEPDHHYPFLYYYLNKPWKSQELINTILDSFYTTKPDGLIGNEDCGQLSAWFVMSAIGLYQINPGQAEFLILNPIFDKIIIKNENGKLITIQKQGNHNYIKEINIDGVKHPGSSLSFHQLLAADSILILTTEKKDSWKFNDRDLPNTSIPDSVSIIENPQILHKGQSFIKKTYIELSHPTPGAVLRYTINGNEPGEKSKIYKKEIKLKKSAIIKTKAYYLNKESKTEEASLVKTNSNYKIQYLTKYSPQYTGGGDSALLNGIKGTTDFRTGNWQGFFGNDMSAIVDLGKKKKLSQITINALQDINSWIWLPEEIIIEFSLDGIHYSTMEIFKDSTVLEKDKIFISTYQFITTIKARYIKITLKNRGKNPSWHKGAGEFSWLFIDEIEIK